MTTGRKSLAVSTTRMKEHWSHLCERIGERRAGSPGDQAAAEYVLSQFREIGLQNVHGESFPCVSVAEARAEIAIGQGETLEPVPARVLAGSPGLSGREP